MALPIATYIYHRYIGLIFVFSDQFWNFATFFKNTWNSKLSLQLDHYNKHKLLYIHSNNA